jgi:hypothetical protein
MTGVRDLETESRTVAGPSANAEPFSVPAGTRYLVPGTLVPNW